jgi:hypothetical protein
MQDIIYVIDISPYNNIIDALAWDIERFYNRTVDLETWYLACERE